MNRLANESSPYLIQHKDNPVDWWPWCPEAFATAKTMNLPIFLSIGYSSCHWCHVMAHESFEDTTVAQLLNEQFISIKVDREQRPDIDALYMEAVQVMTGSGGWPMSVFLTPDGKPFFAGTYFPPQDSSGLPSFTTVINAISHAWIDQRSQLDLQAKQLSDALATRTNALIASNENQEVLDYDSLLNSAVSNLTTTLDTKWGGFGNAPKFPQSQLIELLLLHHKRTGSLESLKAARLTLNAMMSGGIYDHLGGGFARYATDSSWLVPHFEKMLYDQAQLARIYAIGHTITGDQNWKQIALETIEYVFNNLDSNGFGLYSSQDADSEGEEGKYYLWQRSEIEEELGENAGAFIEHYGVSDSGNFEGSNILYLAKFGKLQHNQEVEDAKLTLRRKRSQRIPPNLDDKIILEWNAMFISSLIQVGFMLDCEDFIQTGTSLLDLLESKMYLNSRWMRISHNGTVSQTAFSSDYAHIVDAYTRAYEATGLSVYLEKASQFAHQMLDIFEDLDRGGLYYSGEDQEKLIVRTKDIYDGAIPSANSIASRSLIRLSLLTGEDRFQIAAKKLTNLASPLMVEYPHAFPIVLDNLNMISGGATEIVIPGIKRGLITALKKRWLPTCVTAFGDPFDSPIWQNREPGFAYICKGFTCLQPLSNPNELNTTLDLLK